MKRTLIISLVMVVATLPAFAQTKRLPPKITIELTDREYVEFYKKIDSLMGIASNTSNAPATFINPFLQRFGQVWFTIDRKVALQMVADTVGKKNKPNKP